MGDINGFEDAPCDHRAKVRQNSDFSNDSAFNLMFCGGGYCRKSAVY